MFPFQISGGMARRVLTATATAGKADLIIADEPTTGLDPGVIEQSLSHLQELAAKDKGVLLITHDLENAVRIADTLVVLYNGTTVEITPVQSMRTSSDPLHPYTKALWQALPQNGFISLPTTAEPVSDQRGCTFACRCPIATPDCYNSLPQLKSIGGKMVRCNHVAS
jgi:peptide/nickel transport system ATP-binding protein